MILITGCNSLIGNSLIKKLLKKKEDIRCYGFKRPADLPDKIEFISGDLLDTDSLQKACKGVNTIFHLMEIRMKRNYGRKYMKKVNITGTKNILNEAIKSNVKKFVFLSSYMVYGTKNKIPLRQDDQKKPVIPYGKDKLKAEKLCWDMYEKKNLDLTIFRPATITGPNVKNPTILSVLKAALAMHDSNVFYLSGNGNTRFQLLHPDDAAEAIILSSKSKESKGKPYNIGSNNVFTQVEQIVKIKEIAKLDCEIIVISTLKAKLLSLLSRFSKNNYFTKEYLYYILNNVVLDCQRVKIDLNWYPKKTNVDILTETIEWYKNEKC